MTADSDDRCDGEMTDAQLDDLMEAASGELLGHIRATTDPSRPLTAIMTRNTATSQNAAVVFRSRLHGWPKWRGSALQAPRPLWRSKALDRSTVWWTCSGPVHRVQRKGPLGQ